MLMALAMVLLFISVLVTIPPVAALIYFHVSTMPTTGNPIPAGCFSFNCLVSTSRSRRLCTVTVKLIFTSMVVVLGSAFLFMLRKFKIRRASTTEKRINQFAGYSFCLRLVFEMLPFVADFVLQETINKDLGKFIGPYGAIGGAIDFFACTLVYYVLSFLRRSSVTIVKSTNTQV
ncbi:hypothetical protein QR680_015247 [Steinernema hermaphroditum]|uniref:7TM GPCR serpentine receptor class x (Srx) domain-containing protein n=1 Tax=Steinernema hermaphroditum TaxID=289476 RepID=A0AA39LKI4_9BILA|nr:hypothetical protein QR680_015247 [Steinernema hermaphroditum]